MRVLMGNVHIHMNNGYPLDGAAGMPAFLLEPRRRSRFPRAEFR